MTTEAKIEPALTAEEWERVLQEPWMPLNPNVEDEILSDPHGMAAMALYGQPFGFTREDVDELIVAADLCDDASHPETARHILTIARRIEALLPPKP